jgi:hypothetical protein
MILGLGLDGRGIRVRFAEGERSVVFSQELNSTSCGNWRENKCRLDASGLNTRSALVAVAVRAEVKTAMQFRRTVLVTTMHYEALLVSQQRMHSVSVSLLP